MVPSTAVPVTVPAGGVLFIRWVDVDFGAADGDDGLAIDDFRISLLSTTAAAVSVGGRVTKNNGAGIASARVTLTAADGTTRIVQTNPSGFYRFNEVAAGATYIVSAESKRFRFGVPTRAVAVNENIGDVNFTALP